ncbi:hypothetical protein M422DRAFT_82327, partial [Sphaerobolus stellatus SS14]
SVRKLNNGGIILEAHSQRMATRIRDRKSEFVRQLGERAVIKDRNITLLVEFVPITFDTEKTESIAVVENDSRLPVGAIASARWIRPENRRKEGQRVAHLLVKASGAEVANKIL